MHREPRWSPARCLPAKIIVRAVLKQELIEPSRSAVRPTNRYVRERSAVGYRS
jgi:hypothetical protein